MAVIAIQTPSESGTTVTYAACTGGGDTAANNGKMLLHVKNGSGAPITVTVTKSSSASVIDPQYGLLTKADSIVSVGAGAEKFIGPFATGAFNSTSGTIAVTYSGVTTLTIAAIQI
jgi:hypothetical protein